MYRANYRIKLIDEKEILFMNNACFSLLGTHINKLKYIDIYVLKEYKDKSNKVLISDSQIVEYVNILNDLGFDIAYHGVIDYYKKVNKPSNVTDRFKYFDSKSRDIIINQYKEKPLVHLFRIHKKPYYKANNMLAALTFIRYMYEYDYNEILKTFFKFNKYKSLNKYDFSAKFIMAHIFNRKIYTSGHSAMISLYSYRISTIEEAKKRINGNLIGVSSIFASENKRSTKEMIQIGKVLEKLETNKVVKSFKEIYKMIQN